MRGHEVHDQDEGQRVDDLEGHVRHGLGQVVGLHAVPIVEVFPLEGVHLQGEGHHSRHHGREHGEQHAEEEHGAVVEHLTGLVPNVPI